VQSLSRTLAGAAGGATPDPTPRAPAVGHHPGLPVDPPPWACGSPRALLAAVVRKLVGPSALGNVKGTANSRGWPFPAAPWLRRREDHPPGERPQELPVSREWWPRPAGSSPATPAGRCPTPGALTRHLERGARSRSAHGGQPARRGSFCPTRVSSFPRSLKLATSGSSSTCATYRSSCASAKARPRRRDTRLGISPNPPTSRGERDRSALS
jgi:hypothetical protein